MVTPTTLARIPYFDFTSMVPEEAGCSAVAGWPLMLCLCGFLLVMLGSQAFRAMLEFFFVLFLLCFVAHLPFYGRYSHQQVSAGVPLGLLTAVRSF